VGKTCDPLAAASATTGNSENRSVSTSTDNDTLNVATAVQQIMTELSEDVPEKDKTMVNTKIVLNLM
jgi:hypothetical protein